MQTVDAEALRSGAATVVKWNNNGSFTVAEKPEGEEEETGENEQDSSLGDDDTKKKPARTKTIGHVGGPLLAQA